MPDVYHNFPIKKSPSKVYENITGSKGLDNWWTKSSGSNPELGGKYSLYFGPGYNWKALVTKFESDQVFELQFTEADEDWLGTKVGFVLAAKDGKTAVNFYHSGWPQANDHFKISSFCWAMYLRILKRNTELGEQVPYEKRPDV
jgi:uncharacterized protein YndB with AHSA1/START domain